MAAAVRRYRACERTYRKTHIASGAHCTVRRFVEIRRANIASVTCPWLVAAAVAPPGNARYLIRMVAAIRQ